MTSSPAPSTAGKANSTPAGKGGNAAKAIAGAKANAAEIEKAIADEKAKKAAAASAVDISEGVKAATDALDISDGAAVPEWKPLWEKKLEEATASAEPKASDRLEEKIVPLVFTSAKMGAGVSLAFIAVGALLR